MKAIFYALNLLLGALLPAITLGQTPEAVPTFTAEQILPLLKRYDLDGLGKLIGKGELISGKEVNIDLVYDFLERLPFTRMFVADDCVRLRATDQLLYTYCPFPPPTLEKLVAAQSLHEIMNLLVPADQAGSKELRTELDLPIILQDLEKAKESFKVGLRAAYFQDDRLIWIQCMIQYSESDVAKNMLTPFRGSSVSISASPKFK